MKSADRPPLPPGKYYQHELIGFSIVDENQELIGKLTDILRTGANEVYVVKRPDNTEVLLPVIPSVILGVEMETPLINVHLLPGLIDDGKSSPNIQKPTRRSNSSLDICNG